MLTALLISALATAATTVFVSHALLRMFLHERGVRPWTLVDTIGSAPLVIIGSALVGAASALMILLRTYDGAIGLAFEATTERAALHGPNGPRSLDNLYDALVGYGIAVVAALVGVSLMWLGINSLKKLL